MQTIIKKSLLIIVLLIVLIIALFNDNSTTTSNNDYQNVNTLKINNNPKLINTTGIITSIETYSEYYSVLDYGELLNVNVKLNQLVNKGDLIIDGYYNNYYAPFTGYIIELNAVEAYNQSKDAFNTNSFINNKIPLYKIVSNKYEITSQLDEYQVANLPSEYKVSYSINVIDKSLVYEANIKSLDIIPKTSEDNKVYYPLVLNVVGGLELIKPGYSVNIVIEDVNVSSLIIPDGSYIKENDKYYVYLINKINNEYSITKKTEIKGIESDLGFLVESGLVIDDLIVLKDLNLIKNKQKVIIK